MQLQCLINSYITCICFMVWIWKSIVFICRCLVKKQNFSCTFYMVFAVFAQQTMSYIDYRNAQPMLSDKLIAWRLNIEVFIIIHVYLDACACCGTLDSVVNKSIDREIVIWNIIKRQRIILFLHRIIFCV